MIRLPTRKIEWETARAIAKNDVKSFRDRYSPEMDPDHFFGSLTEHLSVPNDLTFRATVVRAINPSRNFGLPPHDLLPDEIKVVKRLVKLIRDEIASIHGLRHQYCDLGTQRHRNAVKASSGPNRLIRQHRKNLSGYYASLDAHFGSAPGSNVAEVFHRVEDVKLKLATKSSSCRYEEAVSDLNDLLDKWPTATHAKQGKRASVTELDQLIGRLGQFYERITGRPANTGKHFSGFVEIVVDQLPFLDITVKNTGDQSRLKKRIQHALTESRLLLIF